QVVHGPHVVSPQGQGQKQTPQVPRSDRAVVGQVERGAVGLDPGESSALAEHHEHNADKYGQGGHGNQDHDENRHGSDRATQPSPTGGASAVASNRTRLPPFPLVLVSLPLPV